MSRLVRSVSSSWTVVAGSQGNWAEIGSAAASPAWSRCRGTDASVAALDGAAALVVVTSTVVAGAEVGDTEDESDTVELAPDTGDDVSEGSPQPTSAVVPSTTSIVVILVQRREECLCRLWSSTVRLGIIVLPMTRTPQQAPGSTPDFDSSVLPDLTCGAEPDSVPCGDRWHTATIDTTNPMSSTPSSFGTRGGSVTGDDALRISAGESSSSRGDGAGGRRRARSRCCPSLRTRPTTEIRR